MYTRAYFSLLLAFALGIILVSSAPVDPQSQVAGSYGKARRKISLSKAPAAPAKPPPAPAKAPATEPAPAKAPVTEPASPASTKPAAIASTTAKPSVTSAAASSASSVASSSVSSVASSVTKSSSTTAVTSSAASTAISSSASSVASSAASTAISSSASSVASSAASTAISSSASSVASSVTSATAVVSSAASTAVSSSPAESSSASATSSSASSDASASSCPLPQTKRSVLERRAGITSGTDTPVCGIPFRLGTLPTKCQSNPISFTTPLTPITKVSNTGGTLAAGTQCDHSLELQALKSAMDASGACTALDAIIKAGGVTNPSAASQKQSLLSDMFDQINGQSNAFSLDSSVNGAKKLVVQAGLTQGAKCTASSSTDLKKAVNAYFTDSSINGPTIALASTLDNLATTAVNNAAANALTAIKCLPEGSSRQKTTKTNAQQAVASAKALYKSPTTMTTQWNNVLACSAALAA